MPREIWVNNMATLKDFAEALSKCYNIPIENILATKINSPWSFHRVVLPFADWVHVSDVNNSEAYMHSSPFYLSTDGILFIIRDSQTELRDMTQVEKDMYHCHEFESQMFVGTQKDGTGKKAYKPEAGVKITVMAKKQE